MIFELPRNQNSSLGSVISNKSQNLVAATAANSSQNANSPSVSSTTNAGALAGGIVGAFFGGVMLALMAAYAFDHRRKSSPYKTRRSKAVESVHGAPTGKSLGPATIVPAWERLIPQPVDDETMTSLVKSLLDRVALHVDNFYSRKSVQISALDLETFARVDSNLLPYPLPEVMIDPKMQLLAIKHCIAFALTNSIMPGDSASNKILPIYLAALPLKLASNSDSEKDTKSEFHKIADNRRTRADPSSSHSSSICSLENIDILPDPEASRRACIGRTPTPSHPKSCQRYFCCFPGMGSQSG
jgi:hypothetical protein